MHYYTQYKCQLLHNVCINNVPKQCVRLLYTYTLNSEENGLGPDSRQVPSVVLVVGQPGELMLPSQAEIPTTVSV